MLPRKIGRPTEPKLTVNVDVLMVCIALGLVGGLFVALTTGGSLFTRTRADVCVASCR